MGKESVAAAAMGRMRRKGRKRLLGGGGGGRSHLASRRHAKEMTVAVLTDEQIPRARTPL